MNVQAFLDEIRADPDYAGQIVYVREVPARTARFAAREDDPSAGLGEVLARIGVERLYSHQAEAWRHVRNGKNVVVSTGTASGKTLCYALPLIELLRSDPHATALLLFPTKALCQDQFKKFSALLEAAGMQGCLAGVFDGDTPSNLRRRLRDGAAVIFSNPDMLHAALMPQHARWAEFLGRLHLLVLDEVHVYSGLFGSNMAHLLRRFFRVCEHYGSSPRIVACSATIANSCELVAKLANRPFEVVDQDGSPAGKRTYVFWNPPRVRNTEWRSRRSANVEAHDLMAKLIARGIPTITFSKAKMTAEMIYRYVCDALRRTAPHLVSKVTPYRGGYLPAERREIEKRLFAGELIGVSTTPALELGIDVGNLEASILVGYPGTLASFFQQSGRAGRKDEDAVVFLVGLDTSVNQYIMSEPDYLFERCIEQAVIDPDNPFVVLGQLRCAAFEKPIAATELDQFGCYAGTVVDVLAHNMKLKEIDRHWYYSAPEIPQHEMSLRNMSGANVIIQDVDSGAVLGEVDRYDSQPILHPEAVYMHRGDTYIVLSLDLERNIAMVKRQDVDYYTQPLGGTDIHHIDRQLREKQFGTGKVYWGEVTAYFNTGAFEKIHFYSLDAISLHRVKLPTLVLETMAVWIVPPEDLMESVRSAGLDPYNGLRGIGYGTRMLLPLFMTCDTLDFSHTVGSVNSPWHAVFIYDRYPHGLGFSEKAYELMHLILPRVLESIRNCPCEDGCPCCVGKPLRQYATWNVERWEASIPSKRAALMVLEGLMTDPSDLRHEDLHALTDSATSRDERLEQALRRRLEVAREPETFHPILPAPQVETGYGAREEDEHLAEPDVARRAERHKAFDKDLHKRIAKKIQIDKLDPLIAKPPLPPGMSRRGSDAKPTDFPGRPRPEGQAPPDTVVKGDSLSSRARKLYRKRSKGSPGS